ncbi:hypothetical protein OU787_02020 [Kitasatospora sp. YST-16]|uniref:hypothetical protein n=1 Tax=Kitasatospora sp. YST-16 TaxID=2998080 RepID=UPI002284F584|nr:hypothetical protein [Kitasatospora sp. YST-16]WAL70373.1 hypothetical protein OU787_02020 [Kitasatospora sp. YST-16]WNW36414.1 hypothetical protein RKE32_02025 [Streptomyces sp. Li-HN-5-13]
MLAWLYRRTVAAPEATARRLVYVLPQGSLAHWTHARIGRWLHRLGLADAVDLHLLAGPDGQNGAWRRHPERSAILVGTHDVLLSRALMRGLADSRTMAPVSFGLLNNDAHWVFDEAGLLGPGLPTGERLQALREALGTTAPTGSTWMSAVGDGSAPRPGPARPRCAGSGSCTRTRSGTWPTWWRRWAPRTGPAPGRSPRSAPRPGPARCTPHCGPRTRGGRWRCCSRTTVPPNSRCPQGSRRTASWW